jgi:hypothetical protein
MTALTGTPEAGVRIFVDPMDPLFGSIAPALGPSWVQNHQSMELHDGIPLTLCFSLGPFGSIQIRISFPRKYFCQIDTEIDGPIGPTLICVIYRKLHVDPSWTHDRPTLDPRISFCIEDHIKKHRGHISPRAS